MRTVDLGDGLRVSGIGFGAMALSNVYGPSDHHQRLRTLHAAIDAGVTFIDTADVYGEPRENAVGPAGTNEELVAELLRERRGEVQLATKFGIVGAVGTGAPVRGDAAYVQSACEASLRRLGTDVIDLYYLHRRDLSVPLAETVGAMAALVEQGKVRHLGLSEVIAEELREANQIHPIAAVQSEWSLWSRDVEDAVVPTCVELGVGFVPYSPLGRGFLTGTLSAERIAQTVLDGELRFSGDALIANQRVIERVRQVADGRGLTAAQVALAWLYAQGRRFGLPVVPIPGTRSDERVQENAAAVELALTPAELNLLDEVAGLTVGSRSLTFNPPGWISGERE